PTIVVIVLLMWFVLFDRNRPGKLREGSELLIGSAFFSLLATLAARGLAISVPFKARPIASPLLHFRLPYGGSLVLIHWSSFPSDHAVLLCALATGIFLVSRRVGWFAVLWVALVICFPLLYIGVHWPTDILVGAAIGVSFAQLSRIPRIREFVRRATTDWHRNHPELFFPALFLFSYGVVTLFEDVRRLLKLLWGLV
ncbi:MAG: phosphatase PAP2 family protein, partial [Terracidiphilus sp.]